MKVNKLVVDYQYDFDLVGVLTSVKEYKLAWAINKEMNIKLAKARDINIDFRDNKRIIISNYLFESTHNIVRLLKNRILEEDIMQSFLLPDLRELDYFIMVEGGGDIVDIQDLMQKLRDLSFIQYVVQLDVYKIRSKENLIF